MVLRLDLAPSPLTKSMPPFLGGFRAPGIPAFCRDCKLGPPRWRSCQPSSTSKATSKHLLPKRLMAMSIWENLKKDSVCFLQLRERIRRPIRKHDLSEAVRDTHSFKSCGKREQGQKQKSKGRTQNLSHVRLLTGTRLAYQQRSSRGPHRTTSSTDQPHPS